MRRRLSSGQGGGLLLTGPFFQPAPLRDGPDISWTSQCLVGNDQGPDGACAIYGICSWGNVMLGKPISDRERTRRYRLALADLKRPLGSGLTVEEAYRYCADLLPGTSGVRQVRNTSAMVEQPLLAAYYALPHFGVPRKGVLNHHADGPLDGPHLVLMAAIGHVAGSPYKWVTIENSWGLKWAHKGLAMFTESLHLRMSLGLWKIV